MGSYVHFTLGAKQERLPGAVSSWNRAKKESVDVMHYMGMERGRRTRTPRLVFLAGR